MISNGVHNPSAQEADLLLASIGEAQTRAANQRAVAERLLDEARALEVRLKAEAEQASVALSKMQDLVAAVEAARDLEHEAEAALRERRAAREHMEADLDSVREAARAFAETIVPADSDAARRIAERRAADAARAKIAR